LKIVVPSWSCFGEVANSKKIIDLGVSMADLVAHWLAVLVVQGLDPGKGIEKTKLVFLFLCSN
jgi:hypothetical protein